MRAALLALLLSVSVLGCDSADEPTPDAALLLPDLARYDWSVESRHIEGDSLVFSEAGTVTLRIVDRNASVPGYRELSEMDVVVEAGASSGRSQAWYEVGSARLRDIAYSLEDPTPVVQPRGVHAPTRTADVFGLPRTVAELMRRHEAARSIDDDSITVRTDPRVVYELPLEVGAAWISFTDPFESSREVVGRETITVAAGTFDCFVVRTEVGFSGDDETFEWLDYVSPEHGLVLRTVDLTAPYGTPEGDTDGRIRTTERLERVVDR